MKSSLNIRLILSILSSISLIIGVTMLVGFICSVIYRERTMGDIFLTLMLTLTLAGLAGIRFSRRKLALRAIKIREGILSVSLCWIFAAALCALPYLLAGTHHSFIDAFFESTACITTTSSTLVGALAELPKSLLFWRQLTNWLGGLGIIIIAITIIPMLGFGAANLATAEMSELTLDKVRTRISDMARSIVFFYVALTATEILLLYLGGTGIFDSIVLSLSSMGNGGFAEYKAGATHESLYTEIVISAFCIIASLSFVSYQHLLKGRVRSFFKETEIRLYLTLLGVVCAIVFIILLASGTYETAGDAARYGIVQTISFTTTAGYTGTNINEWPQAVYWILIIVMIIGGCSGSTSGGAKVGRVAVAFSLVRRNIYMRLHPNAIVNVKLGDKTVSEERVSSMVTYVILYIVITLGSCFVLSFENLDAGSALGTVISTLSNTGHVIGPGIGISGAYSGFSQFSLFYMSMLMIAGRLELLTFVLLFSPSFWRPYKFKL